MAVLVDTQFTGSVIATGTYQSLTLPVGFVGTASKALLSDTASNAVYANAALTASYVTNMTASTIVGQPLNVLSSSFATNSIQSLWAVASISSSYAYLANYANFVNWEPAAGTDLVALDESRVFTSNYNLPTGVNSATYYVVNNTVYMVGGYTSGNVNTIWTSSFGNPEIWGVATGRTLPSPKRYTIIRKIGNALYMFGGYDSGDIATKDILVANIASPYTWLLAATMSYPLVGHQMVALNGGNDLWIFGGASGSAVQPFTMSMYATASNPLSWSLQPLSWTAPGGAQMPIDGYLTVIGQTMYYYGGFSQSYSTNYTNVLTASISNPTKWGIGTSAAPAMGYLSDGGVIVGNYLYFFGSTTGATATTTIWRAPLNNPLQVSASAFTMSRAGTTLKPFIFSGSVFMVGGYAGSPVNVIWKAPIVDYGPTASAVVDLTSDTSIYVMTMGSIPKVLNNYFNTNIQPMTASVATQGSASAVSNNTNYSIALFPSSSGIMPFYSDFDSDLNYNPFSSLLSVPFVSASLMGTASWAVTASNIITASNAITASDALFSETSSHAFFAETASYAQTVITQQLDISYSYASSSTFSSASSTADFAVLAGQALTSSIVVTASLAVTASFAMTSLTQIVDYIGVQVFS